MKATIGAQQYIEISSKTGHNLKHLFEQAVDLVLKDRSGSDGRSNSVSAGSAKKKQGGKNRGCQLL